jgi:hypothetical protein
MYDVPRSVKSYVSHMETKYDQLVQNKVGSTSSLSRESQGPRHSRHNSASSIFSAYGYTRKGSVVSNQEFMNGTTPKQVLGGQQSGSISSLTSVSSNQMHPGNELYDVPRSACPPRTLPRQCTTAGSLASISSSISNSHKSLKSKTTSQHDSHESIGTNYDVPSSFERKLSLCDSTETLSCRDTFDETHELRLGASSSSLSSSSSRNLRSVSQCNNFGGSTDGATAGTSSNGSSSEVKILPLGPKAAVSVCEKLRQEVVTSIASILENVKPKWRSKDNLTSIMPDLRFSCIRLSLAIKVSLHKMTQ